MNVATSSVVAVDGLWKEYVGLSALLLKRRRPGPASVALRDVTLRVAAGETLGLLGPNGAGKTTLLKTLATLIAPTRGTVTVDGIDVVAAPRQARRRIGIVSCDERSFYWRLSGYQNLLFFAALYRVDRRAAIARIDEVLETLGLTQAAHRPYQSYSSGMKQKLAIARGLLGRPALVLYDEPTRSLDPISAHAIREWIVQERRRSPWQTHIIATNQLSEAEALCDRIVIISRGQLAAEGSIAELRRRWRDADAELHTIVYRRATPIARVDADQTVGLIDSTQVAGHEPDEHVVTLRTARGSTALSVELGRILRNGGTIERCDTRELALDDIFRAAVESNAPAVKECVL